ncbi:hypothetical protein [Streptomyces aurantiogriseus]|uniref:Uncharacterized protein n=1 Tax=Streptomyces aurantiogriseus TaxID=66870 RepID=A0A918L0G7_9ACTN|nr:hypothetical protein [Streptomyces aurantiogriseus]GGR61340.1 hypothetical protein GCM10010251_92650 [Streptomyces aurantiogriseus]
MSERHPLIDLSDASQYEYLPVSWTVPGLPGDRSEYRSQILRDWWDGTSAEERDRFLNEQRSQLAVSVARTTGVRVNPGEITYRVHGVRPGEEPTP